MAGQVVGYLHLIETDFECVRAPKAMADLMDLVKRRKDGRADMRTAVGRRLRRMERDVLDANRRKWVARFAREDARVTNG